MSAILTVFGKEFRENLRERRTVISALIFGPLFVPLLFAGMLAVSVQRAPLQADGPLELAVAHAERAPNLVSRLEEVGVKVAKVDYEDEAARAAVHKRAQKLVLLIPEDYAREFSQGAPAPLLLYADSSDGSAARNLAGVRIVLTQYNVLISRLRLVARGVDPLVLSAIALHDVDVATPAARSVLALGTLSYLVLITMLAGGMYLAIDSTAGERERGSLEPLLTVPVNRSHLIYGKILAAAAFMLLSLTLTVTALAISLRFVGLERFGMSINFGPLTALAMIGACAPLVLLGAALMTVVASFTRTYREAQTYNALVLLVPTVPLVFAGVLSLQPTPALMLVPSLSQHFLIMSLLRNEAIAPAQFALSAGATLLLGAGLAGLAGRLYQREALLG